MRESKSSGLSLKWLAAVMLAVVFVGPVYAQLTSTFPEIESVVLDELSGVPIWLHGRLGELDPSNWEDSALHFMKEIAPVFQLTDSDHLYIHSIATDEIGRTHIRIRQYHNGIHVDGGDMYIHSDDSGIVATLNGLLGADIRDEPFASIAGDEILDIFAIENNAEIIDVLAEPELVYYLRTGKPITLSWRTQITWSDFENLYQDSIYQDAVSGETIAKESLNRSSVAQKIYDGAHLCVLPGTLMSSSQINSDSIAVKAFDNCSITSDFYDSELGRDSYDDFGSDIKCTVHYCGSNHANAHWNRPGKIMAFGDGDSDYDAFGNALDVVAHEFTHGVVQFEADFTYLGESGAIDEAYGDIMGAAVKAWHLNYSGSSYWKHGESILTPGCSGDATRFLSDPMLDGKCRGYYMDRYTGAGDHTHVNNGIPSLAFYLLCEGGQHPRSKTGVNVPSIGFPKAQRIFYEALCYGLTQNATFQEMRNVTTELATKKYGTSVGDSVSKAWDAVGVPGTPGVHELTNIMTSYYNSGAQASWEHFLFRVPTGMDSMTIKIFGGTGDCDLYVRHLLKPTISDYDYRPYTGGNDETVSVDLPAGGDWFIGLRGWTAYSNVNLSVEYEYLPQILDSEREYNDETEHAYIVDVVSNSTRVIGYITPRICSAPADEDYFNIVLPSNQILSVFLRVPSDKDYDIKLMDSLNNILASGTKATGQTEHIIWQNKHWNAKQVYLRVYGWNGNSSHTKPYKLDVF